MTTTEQPPEVDEAVTGPIIGRRVSTEPVRTAPFSLATYDSQDRETLHSMTARVDIDASSVFGFLSPRVSAGERVAALRSYLLRALIDSDGIALREEIVAVVPPADAKPAAAAEAKPAPSGLSAAPSTPPAPTPVPAPSPAAAPAPAAPAGDAAPK